MPTIALLPGDGIGPEVAAAAVQVLNAVADDLTYEEHPAGGAAIDLHGTALTDEALAACKASDAVLLGALGGPKWDTNESGAVRPEQGLFKPARRARPVRQPAPGPAAAGALRRLAAQARADRGRRHADRARAHRRPLLRRARDRATAARSTRWSTPSPRSSGSPAPAFEAAKRARDVGRQGQRARHQPAVARGRHPHPRRGVPEHRARAPARRRLRDEADRGARATSR